MRKPLALTPRLRAVLTASLVLSGIGLSAYAVLSTSPLFVPTAQANVTQPTFYSHASWRQVDVTTVEHDQFEGHTTLIKGRDVRTGRQQVINVMVDQVDPTIIHKADFVFPHERQWLMVLECGVTVNHQRVAYDYLTDGSSNYHCKHD
jgi:hypothetical protein